MMMVRGEVVKTIFPEVQAAGLPPRTRKVRGGRPVASTELNAVPRSSDEIQFYSASGTVKNGTNGKWKQNYKLKVYSLILASSF